MIKTISLRRKYLIFVILPVILIAGYYSFWASDMYVSEARFSLRGPEGGGSTDLMVFLGQGSGSTTADAYVVQEYIRSMGLLNTLDEQLSLRQHYQSSDADIFTRLSAQASAEELHEYFKKVVQVVFDPVSGIFSLKVRAYAPEMAQRLGEKILEQSELLVNRLRNRALDDALALAHAELETAESHVAKVRDELRQFRKRSDLLNPEAAVGAMLTMLAELEGEAVKARTQMAEARSYMREESAQIVALKARIAALEGQISAERNRLTGADQRELNDVMADYERLMVEREFAEKRYVSALTSLEAARVRAEGKSRYLVAFSPPTLPQESIWPRRLPFTLLALAGASLLFGIVSLVIAAIREHAGF